MSFAQFLSFLDLVLIFLTCDQWLKANAKYESVSIFSQSKHHRDQLIHLGTGYKGNPVLSLRLIEIRSGNCWYRYLTSGLDPNALPPYVVADLYARRWRIEETFKKK
ncbi:MAG: transposase [Hyellaceae cyanobacterium CSU_1_1]|nr:transposase [Hyellaceae cyanobacterium CSU_1_1]